MAVAVGIDLGTMNSVIAATEAGKTDRHTERGGIADNSVSCGFTPQGERLVGQLARRQAILNPKGIVYSAKRFIGRRFGEVQSELNAVSFDVVAGPDGKALIDLSAPWCGPCRMVSPALAEVATEVAGQIKPVKVNLDE